MQPKQRAQLETFNGGVCSIFTENESGTLTPKLTNLRFCERIVGIKRFFAAAAAQMEINRVIRIPQLKFITPHHVVSIGGTTYRIVQVQHINVTSPPVTDLTLRQVEMHLGGGENG